MTAIAFVSNRTDGLGERLRSIVNALYLTHRFSGQFVFDWAVKTGGQAAFHSICELHDIFSDEFIQSHYALHYASLLDQAVEVQVEQLQALTDSGFLSEWHKVFVPQMPIYRYLPSLRSDIANGGFLNSFNAIGFSEQARSVISSVKAMSLPSDLLAVHLRAGDIMYGSFRLNARFCRKAIPYQLADSLLESFAATKQQVILFGQDNNLISYLAAKHGVLVASTLLNDLSSNSAHQALAEIILMSKCKQIIAGSSGFAILASSLAGETLVPINDYLSTSDISPILNTLGMTVDRRISVEQQIFSLRWMIGFHASTLSVTQLEELCLAGLDLAPDDSFFTTVLSGCYANAGQITRAKEMLVSVLSKNTESFNKRLFEPSSFGERLSGDYVLSLLQPLKDSDPKLYFS